MPTSDVPKYKSNMRFLTSEKTNRTAYLSKTDSAGRQKLLISLCTLLGLCHVFSKQAKADFNGDFVGYYSLNNFTLTNTSNGTNGCVSYDTNSCPGDLTSSQMNSTGSVELIGGNFGNGLYGTTDLLITAATSGTVQVYWSYSSSDPSSSGTFPYGCGVGFTGSCDDAGYLLDGNFVELADDIHQQTMSTLLTFSVTAGETFGFRVETLDNLGEPGIFTIMDPAVASGAVPEPRSGAVLLLFIAGVVAGERRIARIKRKKESAA